MMRGLILLFLSLSLIACAHSAKDTGKIDYSDEVTEKELSKTTFVSRRCRTINVKKNDWRVFVKTANRCVKSKKWQILFENSKAFSRNDLDSPWGAYYLSIYFENQGKVKKSLWLIDLAIKKAPELRILKYQRARLLWLYGEKAEAEKELLELGITIETNGQNVARHLPNGFEEGP